jgi:DNA-binding HxlR family transcriptional regulator
MSTMVMTRKYNDGCAGAHALNLVGERWALLVVRELLLGPKRFTDLRAGLPEISPNVLSQRLTELEQASIVRRVRLLPPAGTWVYELTDWGLELEPVICALGRWGARSPTMPRHAPLSIDSLVLSFRTMFDPIAARGVDVTLELHLAEHRFRATVADGTLTLVRGQARDPDAVVAADPGTLAGIAYDGASFAEAVRTGQLQVVQGNKAAVRQFLGLFTLPERAPALDAVAASAAA